MGEHLVSTGRAPCITNESALCHTPEKNISKKNPSGFPEYLTQHINHVALFSLAARKF